MIEAYDLDRKITISLRRDEAIVLYGLLSREIWNKGEAGLKAIYNDEAESHGLQALLQEFVPVLVDTGGPNWDDIRAAAAHHLVARHTV